MQELVRSYPHMAQDGYYLDKMMDAAEYQRLKGAKEIRIESERTDLTLFLDSPQIYFDFVDQFGNPRTSLVRGVAVHESFGSYVAQARRVVGEQVTLPAG